MRSTACTTTSSTTPSSTGWSRRGSSSSTRSCTAAPSTAPRAARSSAPSARAAGACSRSTSRARVRSARACPGTLFAFLAPPIWEELVRRLVGRGTETEEERERRLQTAQGRAGGRVGVRSWSSSTTMFGERAKNSYHGCERVSAPSDAAHRQPRAMHVETNPSARRTPHVRNRGQPHRHHQPADRRPAARSPTPSTRWSSTRPSAPARSTRTTASCRRACSTTSARSSRPRSARSRCRSRSVRSTRASLTAEAARVVTRLVTARVPLRIVLGVSGGIAAYKAASLLRLFTEYGPRRHRRPHRGGAAVRRRADVVGPVGQAGRRPTSGSRVHEVPHVRIGKAADLVVVAPATADLLARARPTGSPTTC